MTQEEKMVIKHDIDDVTSRMELIMDKLRALREIESLSDAPDAWDNYWMLIDIHDFVRRALTTLLDVGYLFKGDEK